MVCAGVVVVVLVGAGCLLQEMRANIEEKNKRKTRVRMVIQVISGTKG